MVDRPAVTSEAMPASSRSGTTSVSGPGQCSAARARGFPANSPIRSAAARSGTWTISGIEARPALGFVDARDRLGVGRVGGEAVDRLGRHRDGLPAPISRAASAIASSPNGMMRVVSAMAARYSGGEPTARMSG